MTGLSSPLYHTKWCKIQLQLYSQRISHNYLTSGFNNIHLKYAQQNCMATALILHCPLILEQYKILESTATNLQWLSRLQHHLLIPDRFLKRISDPICTATPRTCQQNRHYGSVLWLSVTTTVIILSAHLKVTFMANISVSQPALCSQTVFHCMHLQTL